MLVNKRQADAPARLEAQPIKRVRAASDKAKSDAVSALAKTLDSNFFKAIAEPVRQQIVFILLKEGRSSVQDVAKHLVQDRSVVSRHLAFLEQAGFVRSHRVQRYTEYELDGPTIIDKLERMLFQMRMAAAICCPADRGS